MGIIDISFCAGDCFCVHCYYAEICIDSLLKDEVVLLDNGEETQFKSSDEDDDE